MEKLVSDISNLIRGFQQELETTLPILESQVNDLIETKSKDSNEIGHCLDTLLSLTYMGVGDALFVKLLEYYKIVDKEGAKIYWELYDDVED